MAEIPQGWVEIGRDKSGTPIFGPRPKRKLFLPSLCCSADAKPDENLRYICSKCGKPCTVPLVAAKPQQKPAYVAPEGSKPPFGQQNALAGVLGDLPKNERLTGKSWHFMILGDPVGKPRQTQSDRWRKRPAVLKYRAWADAARDTAPPGMTKTPLAVNLVAFIRIPKSYSAKKAKALHGQPHRQKIDADNCAKAVLDALFPADQCIANLSIRKVWTHFHARVEVEVIE